MKFLHISDIHIGKRVKNFSMLENQKDVLAQIITIIKEEKPTAVLIAGDVFDKKQPSGEAMRLWDEFLVELSKLDVKVFISSGNHDSAELIAYASKFIEQAGIYLSPVYNGDVEPVTLEDEYGKLNVYMLPYVSPVVVKNILNDDSIKTYSDAVKAAIEHMNVDYSERNIIVSHQFVTGASRCESEISVGGIDNVDSSSYGDFDYVALGHIHSPQNIGGDNRIRYSGTPLKYSFSEANQTKSVTVVEINEKGNRNVYTRELTAIKDFVKDKGSFQEIVDKYKDSKPEDYFEITLTDPHDVPDAFRRLQSVLPNLMMMLYSRKLKRNTEAASVSKSNAGLSDFQLVEKLYLLQNGEQLSDVQAEYIKSILDLLKEEDKI